jgi:C4-dicarboxylate-specific signal transduction histidine kinase
MVSELAGAREREIADQARTDAIKTELARVGRLTTMGQMAASFAHEINQPLAAIVVNGDVGLRWLAHPTPDLEEVRAALTLMVEDGHRASDIVGSIRALFRKADHHKVPLDVNELIREVLRLLRGELHNERISVRTELPNEMPKVLANRVQLQLVFRNVMTNAIEAMSSITDVERVLRVTSKISDPSSVLVAVADSGTGIDPNSMDRIFDAFFTTKTHGMGMGLSICRSIVEAHGGKLSASPAHPHGTILEIILPIAKPDER